VDYHGAANLIFASGVEHGAMARNNAVLETTYTIFTSTSFTPEELVANSDILSTQSTGLSGRVIQVNGPVAVRVYDSKGNLTGPDANLVLLVRDIPGLFYQINDTNSVVIKLPETGEYRIELRRAAAQRQPHVWNYDRQGHPHHPVLEIALPAPAAWGCWR
jgi:hypothetical protein